LKKGVEQAWPVCFQRVKISGVTFIRNGNASLRAVHLLAVAVVRHQRAALATERWKACAPSPILNFASLKVNGNRIPQEHGGDEYTGGLCHP
jgi:hypothetical protein